MFHQWRLKPMLKRTNATLWECVACGLTAFGKIAPTRGECRLPVPEPLIVHCRHFGGEIGQVSCGCGSRDKKMPVHVCAVLGPCTERSTNKPQRFEGQKIAVCLGCPKRES